MKKFLFKISFYLLIIIAVFAYWGSFADGNTDDNYMHFAVEKPQNIILGDSRASQAVVPDVLEKKLSMKFDNFALNVVQSPYGEVYFNALKKKIAPNTQNGIFILTVNPWNLSLPKGVTKSEEFPEIHSPLNNMYFYDMSPNYEYLLRNYTRSWYKIYSERAEIGRSNTFLHKNGWLEVTVNMNKDSVAKREVEKISFYKNIAKSQNLSQIRLRSLENSFKFLKGKGQVYLVRIPTSERMLNLENSYSPDFNDVMKKLAIKNNLKYFDFSKESKDFLYTDGNHMYKESGKKFTAQIADSILYNTKVEKR